MQQDACIDLPDEIVVHIFSFLSAEELLAASKVCRRWRAIGDEGTLWRGICEKIWGVTFQNPGRQWKNFYMRITKNVDLSLTWTNYSAKWIKHFIKSIGSGQSLLPSFASPSAEYPKIEWEGTVISPPRLVSMNEPENNHISATQRMVRVIVQMPRYHTLLPWIGAGDVELWCPVKDYPLAVLRKLTERLRQRPLREINHNNKSDNRKMDSAFVLNQKCESLSVGDHIVFSGRLFRPKQRLGASLVAPFSRPAPCYHSIMATDVNTSFHHSMFKMLFPSMLPHLLIFLFLPSLWISFHEHPTLLQAGRLLSTLIYPLLLSVTLRPPKLPYPNNIWRYLAVAVHCMILLASFYFASYMLDEIPRLLIATPMAAFFLWGHAAKILYIFLRDYTEIPYHLNILASPMKEQLRAEEIAASNSYKNKFFILGLSGAQCIVIIIGCLLCGISYLDSLVEAVLGVLISIVELLPLLLVLPLYRIQAMFPYFPTPVARGLQLCGGLILLWYSFLYIAQVGIMLCISYALVLLGARSCFVDTFMYLSEVNRRIVKTFFNVLFLVVNTARSIFSRKKVGKRPKSADATTVKIKHNKNSHGNTGTPSSFNSKKDRNKLPKFANKGGGKHSYR